MASVGGKIGVNETSQGKAPGRKPQRPMRPRELEDALNYYLYHPLAWRLALVLAKTPLTPNMVSVIGAMNVVAAAFVYAWGYAHGWGWPGAALGMALHMAWHVWDGADGDLARITGRASPIGEMVDGICDYASHVVMYFCLGWIAYQQITVWTGSWLIGLIALPLMLAAGVSHVIQANHVEVQKRSYQWWVYAKPWIRQTRDKADESTKKGASGALVSLYMYVGGKFATNTPLIDEAVDEAQGDPARLEVIRAAARLEAPRLLAILKVLGPNPRAVLLGVSMLAGSPLWFFLWQTVLLNLALKASIRMHNAAALRILAAIGR
ncbi:MAG: CDP-alcohol phosphatidyltransferase family protein [Sphingomonadales bacterium]|nr:CDP-alcohol phosphatidyltransferase family protein [Sphingomonadales bacterium]MDE2170377.1 CDP-alcohol phosphatidyltransferase family protein [Sphingomonadales bacterium]